MKINDAVRDSWNAWSDDYFAMEYSQPETLNLLKADPARAFPPAVWQNIRALFPDLHDKRVCVPSSGDNLAAFAFFLLGADVTSCDLAERQLENARQIAAEQGWRLRFCVCDSMEMDGIADEAFDLVYTSNGVHTWICDLPAMYRQFYRILRPGGHYLFFETHPFNRPFDDETTRLQIKKRYDDTRENDWRVQDFINSLLESGFTVARMDELFADRGTLGASWWEPDEWDEKSDWHKNPYAALPQWISFCAGKQPAPAVPPKTS